MSESDWQALLGAVAEIQESVERLESICTACAVVVALLFGAFLFRLVVLFKNQRSLWVLLFACCFPSVVSAQSYEITATSTANGWNSKKAALASLYDGESFEFEAQSHLGSYDYVYLGWGDSAGSASRVGWYKFAGDQHFQMRCNPATITDAVGNSISRSITDIQPGEVLGCQWDQGTNVVTYTRNGAVVGYGQAYARSTVSGYFGVHQYRYEQVTTGVRLFDWAGAEMPLTVAGVGIDAAAQAGGGGGGAAVPTHEVVGAPSQYCPHPVFIFRPNIDANGNLSPNYAYSCGQQQGNEHGWSWWKDDGTALLHECCVLDVEDHPWSNVCYYVPIVFGAVADNPPPHEDSTITVYGTQWVQQCPCRDQDDDGLMNGWDDDADGDGILNVFDVTPFGDDEECNPEADNCDPAGDADGDGVRNDADGDDDNDGCPDTNEDGYPFGDDSDCYIPWDPNWIPCPKGDFDEDGFLNDADPCPCFHGETDCMENPCYSWRVCQEVLAAADCPCPGASGRVDPCAEGSAFLPEDWPECDFDGDGCPNWKDPDPCDDFETCVVCDFSFEEYRDRLAAKLDTFADDNELVPGELGDPNGVRNGVIELTFVDSVPAAQFFYSLADPTAAKGTALSGVAAEYNTFLGAVRLFLVAAFAWYYLHGIFQTLVRL